MAKLFIDDLSLVTLSMQNVFYVNLLNFFFFFLGKKATSLTSETLWKRIDGPVNSDLFWYSEGSTTTDCTTGWKNKIKYICLMALFSAYITYCKTDEKR